MQIKSYKLAVKFPEYGVVTFPQLLFFRGKIPFRYDMTGKFLALFQLTFFASAWHLIRNILMTRQRAKSFIMALFI